MARLFGTDGVRGLAGSELTRELAGALGRAAARVLTRGQGRPSFVVARDTRASGAWLEEALVDGIREAGGDALTAGILPTPAVSFLVADVGSDAGAVISASHNPPEYNGIKFFGPEGSKLDDGLEEEIEALVTSRAAPVGATPGRAEPLGDAAERYLAHLVSTAGARLDGIQVVVDCANGAAWSVAPEALRRLGAEVEAIHDRPDGGNINVGCGALHPEVVAAAVVERGADAGVTLDGDADRALFADGRGHVIDGDQVLAASALALKEEGALAGETVVSTVMANLGFLRAMEEGGVRVVQTRVGDRYVLEEMHRIGAVLGGEQSGHIVFARHAGTGDGILTAVQFLSLAVRKGLGIADLAACMRRYPQVLENVRVADPSGLEEASRVWEAVRAAEADLGSRGRVLVRASGTEPVVRVMVEADSEAAARGHAEDIVRAVRAALPGS